MDHSGLAENFSLRSGTMVSHLQVSAPQGKENAFIEGEKEGGKVMGNKDSIAFHWLSP